MSSFSMRRVNETLPEPIDVMSYRRAIRDHVFAELRIRFSDAGLLGSGFLTSLGHCEDDFVTVHVVKDDEGTPLYTVEAFCEQLQSEMRSSGYEVTIIVDR